MRRRSPILLAVLALLATTTGLVLAISPAQAEGPEDVTITAYGGHAYRNVAGVRFSWIRPGGGQVLPAGVTMSGSLTCTAVLGGAAIDNELPGGRYDIDPTSCSGLTLTGPNAADYQLKYAATTTQPYLVRYGDIDQLLDSSATGVITSMLKGKATYSGRLRDFHTKQPIVGLPVVIWSEMTPLPILGGKICSTVTDANGRFTCNAAPISWSLVGLPYSVRTGLTNNYNGTYFQLMQPFS